MTNNKQLITIIVPIYNVEKYLVECLDSITEQTDNNFHVILVNDGSTDSSGKIAKEYQKKYPELFEYVEQENRGLGGARNTGLKHVKTPYVRFFDSDDFMAQRTMENLNKEIKECKENIDIFYFDPTIYDMVTHSYQLWYDSEYFDEIVNVGETIDAHSNPKLMQTEANVCRCVWNVEFLRRNNFSFIEHSYWEDVPAHFLLLHKAGLIKRLDVKGAYYYRTNSPTQVTSGGGKNRLQLKNVFKEISPYFKSKEWSTDEKINMIAFLSNYMFWNINVTNDEYIDQLVNMSCDFFKKNVGFGLYISFFLKTKVCLRNKLLIYFLRHKHLSNKLKNRETIDSYMKVFKKIKGVFK